MRLISAALQAHFAQATTSIATYAHVARLDGQIFGWTSHDQNQTIAGVLFAATRGLQTSSVHHTNDLRVNTLDVTMFLDATTEAELVAGIWDDATITLFEANWRNLPAALFDTDCHIILHGVLGATHRQDLQLIAEVRGLSHRLNNRIGSQYSFSCRYRHARWNGTTYAPDIWCGADLTAHIHDGSITAVGADPRLIVTDGASAQADGYYTPYGLITFLSGNNIRLTVEVASWVGKVFTFGRRLPYVVQVGDTYRAVRGDDHTPIDCISVYDNFVNYGGEPHMAGRDKVFGLPQVI